jgi:hypothetical protein
MVHQLPNAVEADQLRLPKRLPQLKLQLPKRALAKVRKNKETISLKR